MLTGRLFYGVAAARPKHLSAYAKSHVRGIVSSASDRDLKDLVEVAVSTKGQAYVGLLYFINISEKRRSFLFLTTLMMDSMRTHTNSIMAYTVCLILFRILPIYGSSVPKCVQYSVLNSPMNK